MSHRHLWSILRMQYYDRRVFIAHDLKAVGSNLLECSSYLFSNLSLNEPLAEVQQYGFA